MFFHQTQDAFSSILCFSIKYKPPRAPGALKTASSYLTLYIGCYRTSLEKTFSRSTNPKTSWSNNVIFPSKNDHFCHSIFFFSIKYRRATASSFALQCPLDGSSNLARGYIFLKSFENPSERAAPRLERRHYGGKTLLQLFRICKSEKIIWCWAYKSQMVLTNQWENTFTTFPIL